MYIEFIKPHKAGIEAGRICFVSESFSDKMIDEGYAKKTTKKAYESYIKKINELKIANSKAKMLEASEQNKLQKETLALSKKDKSKKSGCEGCKKLGKKCNDCDDSAELKEEVKEPETTETNEES